MKNILSMLKSKDYQKQLENDKELMLIKISEKAFKNHTMEDKELFKLCKVKNKEKLYAYLKYLAYSGTSLKNKLLVNAFKKSEGYCTVTIDFLKNKSVGHNYEFNKIESENYIFVPIETKIDHAMMTKVFHNCTMQSFEKTISGKEKRIAIISKETNKFYGVVTIYVNLKNEAYSVTGYGSRDMNNDEISNFLIKNGLISSKAIGIKGMSDYMKLGGMPYGKLNDDAMKLFPGIRFW